MIDVVSIVLETFFFLYNLASEFLKVIIPREVTKFDYRLRYVYDRLQETCKMLSACMVKCISLLFSQCRMKFGSRSGSPVIRLGTKGISITSIYTVDYNIKKEHIQVTKTKSLGQSNWSFYQITLPVSALILAARWKCIPG